LGLFEIEDILFYWKIRALKELVLLSLTFLITLIVNVEMGISVSITVSLLMVIKQSVMPHIGKSLANFCILSLRNPNVAILRYDFETKKFEEHAFMRDINLFHAKHDWFTLPPEMTENRGIVTIRIDESLHFTNIRQVKELFQKIELRGMHPLYAIILDCSNVPDVDANALQILIEVIEQWKKKSVIVCFVKIRPIINSAFIR